MRDTISTDETPQNENAASRSARHDIKHTLGSGVQYKIFKKSGPLFYFDFGCRTFKESNATINMITPVTIGNTCHNWI